MKGRTLYGFICLCGHLSKWVNADNYVFDSWDIIVVSNDFDWEAIVGSTREFLTVADPEPRFFCKPFLSWGLDHFFCKKKITPLHEIDHFESEWGTSTL